MITFERGGDLFTTPDLDALAHGVNLRGVMGAGIAKQFRERYPAMYLDYRQRIAHARLGDALPWFEPGSIAGQGTWIYSLATQYEPGPCAATWAISKAVAAMLEHAAQNNVRRIGMPFIGTGLGGLSRQEVEHALRLACDPSPLDVVVVIR